MYESSQRGFSFVELTVLLPIAGLLATLSVCGVKHCIANAKIAEARDTVSTIAQHASRALQREQRDGGVLSAGTSAGAFSRSLCGSASPVPSFVPDASAYRSTDQDWDSGSVEAGWKCLGFKMTDPQNYQYGYEAAPLSAVGTTAEVTAQGNLDGDDRFSKFVFRGTIASEGTIVWEKCIDETDPNE